MPNCDGVPNLDGVSNFDGEQGNEDTWADLPRTLCDVMTDAIALLDPELRVVYANPALAEWLVTTPEALRGQYYPTLVRGCDGFPHDCSALRAAACGTREGGEHEISSLRGTYQCSAHPLKDPAAMPGHVVCVLRDVTEQKQCEVEQRRQAEHLAALHDIAQSLIARRPLDSILRAALDHSTSLIGAPHGFIALLDTRGTEMRIRVAAGAYSARVGAPIEPGHDIAGRVWQAGHSIVESLALQPPESTPPGFTAFMDAPGPCMCAVGIPLLSESLVVGVLLLVVPAQPRHLPVKELAFLHQFAELTSIAVHNARLYEVVQYELAERQRAEKSLRESEAALRSIFRAAPIGIGMVTGRVFEWINHTLQHMTGRSAAELVGHSARVLYADDAEFERVGRVKYALIDAHGVGSVETDFVHADGHLVHVLLSSAPLDPEAYAAGRASSVVFTALDITRYRQAEADLATTQALLSAAIEQTPAGILIADAPDAHIRIENPASLNIRGGELQELVGTPADLHTNYWQAFHPDGTPAAMEDLPLARAILRGETSRDVEVIIRRPTGEDRWVSVSAAPVRDAAGNIVAGVVVFPDITERKHAEEALRRSEARYRRFVEQSHAGVWEIDLEGVTVFANERLAGILGYTSASNLVGRRLYDFFSRSTAFSALLRSERMVVNGWQGDGQDCVLKHADGTDVYAILSTLPYYGQDGSFAGATLFVTDISARRRMEEALRQSEARYRTLFESAGDAIFIHELSASGEAGAGRFLAANRVACQRLGFSLEELLSRTPADIELTEYAARLPARVDELQRYGHHFYETVHVRADGSTIPTELSSRMIEYEGRPAVLIIARDISERKQVEQVLLRTERLAAMGHLAAALAHEINNPLQSVGSSLELALDFPLEEEERLEYLEAVREEIARLMTITGRVLDFARPMRTERQPVSAADVVHYAFTLAEKQLQHNRIAFLADLPDDLPLVRASRDELAQVFLNLLLNAVEAMPEGGSVRVSAQAVDDRVIVRFADSGPGIPAAMIGRLFEPFQTTKESGTGLGLAISYSIVQQHGGTITAANAAEGGATFTITLPPWGEGENGL